MNATHPNESIIARGVKTHNLKSVDVNFELYKWTAVTGVSGSGKSSLVFDTVYAEAQRRFLETLGTYERQFLQGLPQGDFDFIDNVPAAVALKQSNRSSDPRSLVGSSADIFEPLRQIFFALMEKSCSRCGSPVESHQPDEVIKAVRMHANSKFLMSIPFDWPKEIAKQKEIAKGLLLEGYDRVVKNGQPLAIEEAVALGTSLADFDILLDRFTSQVYDDELQNRTESAWSQVRFSNRFSKLIVWNDTGGEWKNQTFNVRPFCKTCNEHTSLIQTRDLDWQSVLGSCPSCKGLGNVPVLDDNKVIPDKSISLEKGAIKPWTSDTFSWMQSELLKSCKLNGIKTDVAYDSLPKSIKNWIWNGNSGSGENKKTSTDFVAIKEFFDVLEAERYKRNSRILLAKYRKYVTCKDCEGTRLGRAGRNAIAGGRHYHELMNGETTYVLNWFQSVNENPKYKMRLDAVREVFDEVVKKLVLLVNLGLSSSSLTRRCKSLSGGEYQRVLLTRVLGNGLTDALYVLDEPSVGLGREEIPHLIRCLRELRDLGNTILMVEHDPQLILAADNWIELGPGGGVQGGSIVEANGSLQPRCFTKAPSFQFTQPKRKKLDIEKRLFKPTDSIVLEDYTMIHCNHVNFEIPLSKLTVVSGPSGAGKTTLIQYGLAAAIEAFQDKGLTSNDVFNLDDGLGCWKKLHTPPRFLATHRIVSVEQRAMHRSITSVIATVLGIMDELRKIFAALPDSRDAGFTASQYSFNGGGACETCEGRGVLREDLFFLGEVEKECPDCHGKRYAAKVLDIYLGEKNIAEWLGTNVADCVKQLRQYPNIVRPLEVAARLGLGHLPLGASTSEISGGEAQRLRLCAALSEKGKSVFCILDEPTRGLSEFDVSQLLATLLALSEQGHTFVVVEHHEMFKQYAHHLVEMGPGAGINGGQIINREYVES